MSPAAYIHAAGGIGPNATPLAALELAGKLVADAGAVDLRQSGNSGETAMPRLASRLAQLAVTGARVCVGRLAGALPPGTPVYLATGLGDVARTDALYYQVMPPCSEMASPAQFATSGNNMAAFFVAQQFGLTSRNFTLSQQDLSFELALGLALDDLSAGVANMALLGGVDETTLPREFYVRRYPFSGDKLIGEGSAWLTLGKGRTGAIGEIAGVSVSSPATEIDAYAWADRTAEAIRSFADHTGGASVMPGPRVNGPQISALCARLPQLEILDYRGVTGCSPAAAAQVMVSTFCRERQNGGTFLHVNDDAHGRTGVMAWCCYR